MKLNKKTKDLLKTVGVVLAIVLVIGAVPSLFTNDDDSDFDKIYVSYEVGAIDETGARVEDECALYTNDAIECTGFELSAEFDSSIAYEVHFYDEVDAWISKVSNTGLKLIMNPGDMPEGATSIRIVIRPLEDENNKISLFEKIKYANQLTVKITTEEVEESAA